MWSSTNPRSGFVLFEAVVALAIISLVAVALLGTTGAQIRTADKGTTMAVARTLAEDRLSAVRLLDYRNVKDIPDSLEEGEFAEPFDEYRWTITSTEVENEIDLFEIQVVVEGRGQRFPLTSLLYSAQPTRT